MTSFQCGRKGHQKPNCRFYKQELERKKKNKKATIKKTHDVHSKGKQREKENIASGVIIEEILDTKDILCVANTRITSIALVNTLLAVEDYAIEDCT